MALELAQQFRNKTSTAIDGAMAAAAVVHPMTAAPQVYQIYSTHHASGVSLTTWFSFMAFGSIFLSYAILHNIKPMIITQILWFIMDILIVVGVFIYG